MGLDSLYEAAGWVISLVFLLLMMACVEAGFRFARKSAGRVADKATEQITLVEGSLVGVLGLLLGFTMSMAVARFEVRKQLVLDEANAIGTASLRAGLLPAPESTQMRNLLREYVDTRLEFVAAGTDANKLQNVRKQAERLQNEFWSLAVAHGQKDPNPVTAGLLLQSLNQVIDLESARWMAFYNHVPAAVIYMNAIVALLTMTLVGYGFGIDGVHHIFSICLLGMAITVVLGVIIDLDRPRRGFIQVSQQPMVDLQRQLREHKHLSAEWSVRGPA